MAGFDELPDEQQPAGDDMPGTRSPSNEPIGADGTGTAATNADPHDPATADTGTSGGSWAAADRAGSEEGGDAFGPEGTRSEATQADDADASGVADPFDGGGSEAGEER
jgi:hypothetical protein